MKKKILCLMLAVSLLLFAACGSASESGVSGAPPEAPPTGNTLLAELYTALATGDGTQFVVDVFGASPRDGDRVEITSELLETIALTLCTDDAELAAAPETFITWDDRDEIVIQGQNPKQVVVQLIRLDADVTEPAVDKTMMQLQVGETLATYYYAQDVFDTIYSAINASFVPDILTLEGNYVALKASPEVADGASASAPVEVNGKLAVLFTWAAQAGTTSAVVVYDPETGQYEYSAVVGDNAEVLESSGYEGYDLRVRFKSGSVLYINLGDDEDSVTEQLPEEMLERLNTEYANNPTAQRAFDIYPGGKVAAVCLPMGVELWNDGDITRFSNTLITGGMLSRQDDSQAENSGVFVEPRILNGGNTLVCVIDQPGAQFSRNGLMLYDIPTGQTHWQAGLFGAMAQITYLNDTTVTAASESTVYHINLNDYTLQESAHALPEAYAGLLYEAMTEDYENYVFSHRERQPDGSLKTLLHTGNIASPLLTAQSGFYGFFRVGVTAHYVLARGMNEGRVELVVVKYH